MKDERIAELNNEHEAYFLRQVLADRGLPFRVESAESSAFAIYQGSSPWREAGGGAPLVRSYVWGYARDREAILQALEDVRHAQLLEEIPAPPRPRRKWLIKKP